MQMLLHEKRWLDFLSPIWYRRRLYMHLHQHSYIGDAHIDWGLYIHDLKIHECAGKQILRTANCEICLQDLPRPTSDPANMCQITDLPIGLLLEICDHLANDLVEQRYTPVQDTAIYNAIRSCMLLRQPGLDILLKSFPSTDSRNVNLGEVKRPRSIRKALPRTARQEWIHGRKDAESAYQGPAND